MKEKILMIDDDQELCEEFSEILTDEGYDVAAVFDGLRGKRLLEKHAYDIIILDMKMPGLSGIDILKSLKEQGRKERVLIVTGRPSNVDLPRERGHEDEEEILRLADGIVSKPFDIKILLGKIKRLLDKEHT